MVEKCAKTIVVVAKNPVGGIKTYFNYVYSSPIFNDYKFIMVTPKYGIRDYMDSIFSGKSYEYVETEDSNGALIKAVFEILKTRKCDLVNTHGFTSGLVLAPLIKLFRKPHIMTAHDVLLEWQFQGRKGKFKKLGIGLGFRLIDVIMAVGEDAKENLARTYPALEKANKFVAIRNGIDVNRFSQETRRDLKSELGLPSNALLLGFFGRFMSQKGFRYLVEAVERFRVDRPDSPIAVAAFGWGGFIREEQQALRDKGLIDAFHFMPHTDDMPAAIRGVDAVVMPSLWEACPLLPMEAMVAGVPVIASDCIGLKEVTENTPTLRFPSKDSRALLARMYEFSDNKDHHQQAAQAFTKQAFQMFDSNESATGLHRLYEKVLLS